MNLKKRPGISIIVVIIILITGYGMLVSSCSDNRTIFQKFGNEFEVLHQQGLTRLWDMSVTKDNVTVSVKETYYDKSRIIVGVEIEGLKYPPQCFFYYNGQRIENGNNGRLMDANNNLKYALMEPHSDIIADLPDKFDLEFVVKDRQDNPELQKVFDFKIPLDRSQKSEPATSVSPTVPDIEGIPVVPGSVPGNPPGRTNVYSVQLKLVPSKTVYMTGEPVQMELILTNTSVGKVEPITIEPYPPVIYLVKPGGTPDSNQLVKTFPIGSEKKTLAMGEQVTYPLTWDQKDDNGKQASPGWYYYEGKYNMINNALGKAGSGGTEKAFLIQYPQGSMQRTLELNQSQTIAGFPFTTTDGKKQFIELVLTLKQVELSEQGTSFLVIANSPNNPVSGYNNPEWMSNFTEAQDAIDGVISNARWSANTKYLDNGIELRWGSDVNYLDPVPGDAKQLTLVITRFGDWQGRLEFRIPLE